MTTLLINEVDKEKYKNYPSTKVETLSPEMESRVLPIFYEIPKGSKVLDIGSNDGGFIKLLKEKRGCEVFGVDISEKMVEEAKAKGLDVCIGEADRLPFEDKTFDVVTCMEVLSHLPECSMAIKEIRRVLKKGGIFLGSVPHKVLDLAGWEDRRLHQIFFDAESIRTKLKEQFDEVYIRVLNGAQFSIQLAGSYLADQPCEILFKSGKSGTQDWDSALQDKSILRCWMGFTQTPGTIYYRMSGYADKMQKLGAEIAYDAYDEVDRDGPSAWTRKIHWDQSKMRFSNQHIVDTLFTLMKSADLSVFQVTSSQDVLLYLSTFRDKKNIFPLHKKKPLVLEMDDWFFDLPPTNAASGAYKPHSGPEAVAYEQLKLADYVICSTQYLKGKVQELFPGKECHVISNSIDFDIWDKVEKKTKDHELNPDLVRMIYTGSGNHSADLRIIEEPILALIDEFPNLEFLYVNQRDEMFKECKSPRIKKFIGWEPLSKVPQLYADWEPDIGLAPLLDNDFNRVKSNLRWLEYSALKVPTIASKVYPFEKSINNGTDGFVIGNSKKEWYEKMKDLIQNKEKRVKLGEEAYARVKKDFNMDNWAKTYMSILRHIKEDFNKASKGQSWI